MSGDLKILTLGVGDFFSRFRYNTSFAIMAEGQPLIMVDCPAPLRKVIHEASQTAGLELDMGDFHHLILTHLHGDHCNGIEEYGYFKKFFEKRRPNVYTIDEVKDKMWDERLKASMGDFTTPAGEFVEKKYLEDYFDVKVWKEGNVYKIGEVEFEIHNSKHFVPCFGFIVRFRGKAFSYSSDTIYDPEHLKFLNQTPMIIHEAGGPGHTCYEELLQAPDEIKAKLHLVHTSDEFDRESSEFEVLEQGKIYTIK